MGRLSCGIFAGITGIERETDYNGNYTGKYKLNQTYYIGMGAVFFIAILEMIDAAKTAEEYNHKLHEELYPGKPYFGLQPLPKGDGVGISLSYNF